jgi:hypothetical protein
MVKPLQVPAPIKLTHAQAIEITLKPLCRYGDLIVQDGSIRSCLAPSIKQRTGSFEQPATRLYIETLYIGGGWLESCAHMDAIEFGIYFRDYGADGKPTRFREEIDYALEGNPKGDWQRVELQNIASRTAMKGYAQEKKTAPLVNAQKGRQPGSKNPKTQAMIKHVEMLLAALPAKAAAKDVRKADVQGLLTDVSPETLGRYIRKARENVRTKT